MIDDEAFRELVKPLMRPTLFQSPSPFTPNQLALLFLAIVLVSVVGYGFIRWMWGEE